MPRLTDEERAKRAQDRFDSILRKTERWTKRAPLKGVENLKQLFARAAELGISDEEAWRIIRNEPHGHEVGLMVLIAEVMKRSERREASIKVQ